MGSDSGCCPFPATIPAAWDRASLSRARIFHFFDSVPRLWNPVVFQWVPGSWHYSFCRLAHLVSQSFTSLPKSPLICCFWEVFLIVGAAVDLSKVPAEVWGHKQNFKNPCDSLKVLQGRCGQRKGYPPGLNLALSLPSCVTWGEVLTLTLPQFLHSQ